MHHLRPTGSGDVDNLVSHSFIFSSCLLLSLNLYFYSFYHFLLLHYISLFNIVTIFQSNSNSLAVFFSGDETLSVGSPILVYSKQRVKELIVKKYFIKILPNFCNVIICT
jgi:hypothetical protein